MTGRTNEEQGFSAKDNKFDFDQVKHKFLKLFGSKTLASRRHLNPVLLSLLNFVAAVSYINVLFL